jgi:hypothetical protein
MSLTTALRAKQGTVAHENLIIRDSELTQVISNLFNKRVRGATTCLLMPLLLNMRSKKLRKFAILVTQPPFPYGASLRERLAFIARLAVA